jgi:hypothetical protein
MSQEMQKRFLLFLGLCIPSRIGLAMLAKYGSFKIRTYMSYGAILVAFGVIYIYVTGSRKTGVETGGKPIWWNNIRPLHALFYLTFAYMVFNGMSKNAWTVLVADALLGLSAFMVYHYGQNDFSKIKVF